MVSKGSPTYDVVVVGCGNAALCAALSAREQGARVLVLEKAPQEERGGDSYFTGAGFRFVHNGKKDLASIIPDIDSPDMARVDVDPYRAEDYWSDMMRVTRGKVDPELLQTLIQESFPTVAWMAKQGVPWEVRARGVEVGGRLRVPPGTGAGVKGAGVGLVAALVQSAEQHEIEIRYECRVMRLLQDAKGRVCGVAARTPNGLEEIRSNAVVLGSGGFQANPAMRTQYLGALWEFGKVRGTRYNTGETLRAAFEVGAQPSGHFSGGHITLVDANAPPTGDVPTVSGQLTDRGNSYNYGLIVNVKGQRFIDEGEDFTSYTYAKYGVAVQEQPDNLAFVIFDEKTHHLVDPRWINATPVVANTLEEIADGAGIDREAFLATIAEFNASIQPGKFDATVRDGKRTAGITPPKTNWAIPMDTPPYHAYAATGGITFTFGGLRINRHAQVLDTEDRPIPGLYATGEITGMFYHNYPACTGLMRGAVFGRIGGANAAAEARGRPVER